MAFPREPRTHNSLASAFLPAAVTDHLPPEPAPWLPVGACFTRPIFFARFSITESLRRPSRESSPNFLAMSPATAPLPSDAIAFNTRGVVNRIGCFARRARLELVRFIAIVVSVEVWNRVSLSSRGVRRFVGCALYQRPKPSGNRRPYCMAAALNVRSIGLR